MSGSWILEHLHPALQLDWCAMGKYTEPTPSAEISELQSAVSDLPEEYLDVIGAHQFVSLSTVPDAKPFFTIDFLAPMDVLGWKQWYPFLERDLPGCFFFGQDGDCCFFMGEHEGRAGVYRIEISVADWEYAKYVAPSIRDMLCDGVGWANGELE